MYIQYPSPFPGNTCRPLLATFALRLCWLVWSWSSWWLSSWSSWWLSSWLWWWIWWWWCIRCYYSLPSSATLPATDEDNDADYDATNDDHVYDDDEYGDDVEGGDEDDNILGVTTGCHLPPHCRLLLGFQHSPLLSGWVSSDKYQYFVSIYLFDILLEFSFFLYSDIKANVCNFACSTLKLNSQ